MKLSAVVPIFDWGRNYERANLRSDVVAGVTIAAMLVPQAMAYALLAGLPPEVGLYAATVPVVVYALFGTSRQLAVGPVAIVSLMTASALAPIVEEGTVGYVSAASMLALLVGALHVLLGLVRLGRLVNVLSHSVLVGFTAAAAVIIGVSQIKHVLGVQVDRQDHFYETVSETVAVFGQTHAPTALLSLGCLAVLFGIKRFAPKVPSSLLVVVLATIIVGGLNLDQEGVNVVGDIPAALPSFAVPTFEGGLVGDLLPAAMVITLVGFMESIAVAKVYARRHDYQLCPNQELAGLGAANVASGLFGGYPVAGGFARSAVNEAAGARTPLASVVTASLVLLTIAFFTPLLTSLPNAALGALIISAVFRLVDTAEIRRIAQTDQAGFISLVMVFVATLTLGIELGIALAVVLSVGGAVWRQASLDRSPQFVSPSEPTPTGGKIS